MGVLGATVTDVAELVAELRLFNHHKAADFIEQLAAEVDRLVGVMGW